ncbi:MAG: DUF3943 domain-containing protein, partial [Spirochaetaceae bacterium]|nr:DUF3943 domain-containing protein [Spirochaetaceae bacterium]
MNINTYCSYGNTSSGGFMGRETLCCGLALSVFLAAGLSAQGLPGARESPDGEITRQQAEADSGILPAREKKLYPALLGGLFANAAFHLTVRLFGADFAQTNLESIKVNINSLWVWDNDRFPFNHPGHPYQGGLYHAAARASGFTFYESI